MASPNLTTSSTLNVLVMRDEKCLKVILQKKFETERCLSESDRIFQTAAASQTNERPPLVVNRNRGTFSWPQWTKQRCWHFDT